MDAQRMLRRSLPLVLLAGLAALLLRRRHARQAMPVILPAQAKPQLLLPPVEAALVVVEEIEPGEVTVVAAPERVVVPEPLDVRITARPVPAGRFEHARVDIVTVVDDLLGTAP
jgi:hypothetical protein